MRMLSLLLFTTAWPLVAAESALWGKDGEKWDAREGLSDFTRAGYRGGEKIPASFPDAKSVKAREFGAIPNDGKDDTKALQKALDQGEGHVVKLEAGRYDLSDRIYLRHPRLVLRGNGATELFFSKSLNDIDPQPTKNSGGTPTSKYSWSGGLIRVEGKVATQQTVPLQRLAERGERVLHLESEPTGLSKGDVLIIRQTYRVDNGFVEYLYNDDPSDTSKFVDGWNFSFPVRVAEVKGAQVHLQEPLRIRVSPEWGAVLQQQEWKLTESGVENLKIIFPDRAYEGHFKEQGFNAIALSNVADCWVRNVTIRNADSGIMVSGRNNTLTGLKFEAPGITPRQKGLTGHHGMILGGMDHLVSDFEYATTMIHDITLTKASTGSVIMDGKGVNLSLDHHKRAPFSNLFTNLDLGVGSRFTVSGGGAKLGRNAGGWNVYWNLRSEKPVVFPVGFGPKSIKLVGVPLKNSDELEAKGTWVETKPVEPTNLYLAQKERR